MTHIFYNHIRIKVFANGRHRGWVKIVIRAETSYGVDIDIDVCLMDGIRCVMTGHIELNYYNAIRSGSGYL